MNLSNYIMFQVLEELNIKLTLRINATYILNIHTQQKRHYFNVIHFFNGKKIFLLENKKLNNVKLEIFFKKGMHCIVIYPTNASHPNLNFIQFSIHLGNTFIPYSVEIKKQHMLENESSDDFNFYNNKITNKLLISIKKNIMEFSEKINKYKNILFFCTDYPSYGGASTNCYDLINYYSNNHNTYGIFYTLENKNDFYNNYCVVNTEKIYKAIKKLKFIPDLIILKNYIPIDLKEYFNCPIFFLIPGIFLEHLDRLHEELYTITECDYFIDKNVISQIKKSDESYCNSSHTQNILFSKYGIETNLFYSGFVKYQKQNINKHITLKKKYDYALIVSNLNRPIKNAIQSLNFLIKLKLTYKNTNIVIVGKNSNKYLEYGFECHENLSNDDIIKLLYQTTFLIHDSFYESCSNTKIEAFFCNCVIINSKIYNIEYTMNSTNELTNELSNNCKFILLTGGAGFIGSNIADFLLSKGHKVRVLDNLSTGFIKNIEHLLSNPNFEFVKGDITDLATLNIACTNIDLICHQAALGSVPRSVEDPLLSHDNNVNGFLNMLLAAKNNNIKRIVYASSSAVYGDSETLPKIENKIGAPLSPYAITKYVNELYGNVFTKLYDMECIGLRYFNVFGPRQNPEGAYAAVIPKFISSVKNNISPTINGDGNYSRDFTYVDNIVQANYLALFTENKDCFGTIFNVGAGSRITILEMYNTIAKSFNSDLQPILGALRKGDIPHSNANIDKAKELLGYNPKINFDEGINKTIEYFENI